MSPLVKASAVAAAAVTLGGCPDHRPPPVPGPQSAAGIKVAIPRAAHGTGAVAAGGGGAREISWFQGTFEEAFARRGCREQDRVLSY